MDCTTEQAAEGMAIVRVLAAVLERLVSANSSPVNHSSYEVTKFHALKAPGINVLQYLERIHKYASCSTECFILALIYIDRLIQRNSFILSDLNVHRVVITAILLAAKFFDDAYYNNAYYAKVGGVHISEMNSLEVEFLFRINFSLHVTPEVFQKYNAELISHAVGANIPLLNFQQDIPQHEVISFAPKAPYFPIDNKKTPIYANTKSCHTDASKIYDPSRHITPSPPPPAYHSSPVQSIRQPPITNSSTQMVCQSNKNEAPYGCTVSSQASSQINHIDHSNNESSLQQVTSVPHGQEQNNFISHTNHFTAVDQHPYSSGPRLQQNTSQPVFSTTENIPDTATTNTHLMSTSEQQFGSHFGGNKQQVPITTHHHYAQYANNSNVHQQQQIAPHLVGGGCSRLTQRYTEVSSYFHHNDPSNATNFLSTSPHIVGAMTPAIRP